MARKFFYFVIAGVLAVPLLIAADAFGQHTEGVRFSTGVVAGSYRGTGVQINESASNFVRDVPLSARVGVGYTSVQPGNARDARRIFINNATNGIPEKSGRVWDFRLDLLRPVKIFSLENAFVFGGPRYARFTGNFKYVGGNEDFDVNSRQWGVGGGLESHFPMSNRVALVVTGGYDFFFPSTLTGHDTSYSPDDENINARGGETYSTADDAIAQLKHQARLMFGFNYSY